MATTTLRPNGTFYNSGWTLSAGSTAHTLVDDDPADDATYVQASATSWLLVFDLGALTLPAYARVSAVGVRIRRRGDGSARFDVGLQYPLTSGGFASQLLSAAEQPSSTITTKTYGSLAAAPGGVPWDNTTIIPNLQVVVAAADTDVRVYEVYVDVTYNEAPTCVITSPLGNVTGSQQPNVEFTYDDPEGDSQERVRIKVFTDTQYNTSGFGPDVSAAFWDSGELLTASTSIAIGVPLPSDDYHVYVKVADAGSSRRYGAWASAEFTMGGELPATPMLSVVADSTYRRATATVTRRDNYLSYAQSAMAADGDEGDGWYPDNNTTLDTISSVSATATTLNETFTGANGALAAGNTDINWTVVKGNFAVSSSQLTSSNSGTILPSAIRTDSTLPSVDHYAQIVVNTLSTVADRSVGLILRMASSGYAGYVVELNQLNNRFSVWRAVDSNTGAKISGFRSLPKTLSLPATFRAEISGSTISVYIRMSNDSSLVLLGQWTDTTITTGTQVGISLYNGGSTSLVDTFEAGDLDPVVSGSSGDYLLQVTATAARQARAISGSRYGWGTPVTAGEALTVTASAWQTSNAARSCRADVEYYDSNSDPLTNVTFSEGWAGTDGAAWDADWTSSHLGAATSTIQSNRGRLTTGTGASTTPARQYASGMSTLADCEVYALLIPSSTTAEMYGVVGLRTDGTYSGTDPGHPAAGYFVEVDPQADSIDVREAGVGSPTLATVSLTIPAQGVYVRLRAHGTTIAMKAWDANTQEPAAWSWVGEDSTWTAAGRVILTANNGADAVSRYFDFDELTVDDLTEHSFGSTFTTSTSSALTEHTRNITVPAGAVYARMVLVAFPTGGGEVFVWDQVGLMPGSSRPWSRGGLTVTNLYGPNDSAFEESADGVAGWTAGTDASVARGTYTAPPSGAALQLSWAGTSGFPDAVYAYGPSAPAEAGLDYAVRAWLWRISALTTLLRVGVRFLDASGGQLEMSLSEDVLPTVATTWQDGSHSMRAPTGTAYVQAVLAATAVTTGAAAITRVTLVQGSSAPTVYQPGPAAPAYALLEYSDDGGITWERVRGTEDAIYPAAGVTSVYDWEAPPGTTRRYRASTAAVDLFIDEGATVVSVPSDEATATLTASGFWFRDPLTPARLIEIQHTGDLDHTSREPQQIHDTLGRRNPVIVSDVVKGEEFRFPLTFTSIAAYRKFEEIRSAATPVLFQGDFGEQWFVRFGGQRRTLLLRSSDRAATPVRQVEIDAAEVNRPDSTVNNFGLVTGIVWELV